MFVKAIIPKEIDGVIRATSYEDKPDIGEVLAIGTGRLLDNGKIIPLQVKIGDIIHFNKYSPDKFNLDGNDYFILREEDTVGIIG